MIRGIVVKGYCSVQETARRWGISMRRVNQYALGRSRAIPNDAIEPEKYRSGPKPTDHPGGAAGKTKPLSTYSALFFADELANANI